MNGNAILLIIIAMIVSGFAIIYPNSWVFRNFGEKPSDTRIAITRFGAVVVLIASIISLVVGLLP